MIRLLRVLAVVLATHAVFGPADVVAQVEEPLTTARYQPSLRFRTITTGRFDIHYHDGEEALAQRLARIVESVAREIDRRFGPPSGRIGVILVDQTDLSNGWATVVPYNLIELAAVPPPGFSEIGNTDDWLHLVFAHEYTHVVHLEKSRGWIGALRNVFGRQPLLYPNIFLPAWQIEGIATYEESALTRQGRVFAGDFRMLLERAAAAGRFAPLDRATTAVIDWPGPTSAYLYGGFFHAYLAETYGEEKFAKLASETAGRLPFLGSPAFRSVYGKSLGTLWKEFEQATAAASPPNPRAATVRRLTRHGFEVASPAFAADGRLFYAVANPHGFPSLMELRDGRPREVTTKYHGRRLSASGHYVIFDQLEVSGLVGLQSDLYAFDVRSRATRRLTRGARAADPDVSADGRRIAYTVQHTGRRAVAISTLNDDGSLGAATDVAGEAAVEYTSPRWSPDGRSIVAERRPLGGASELVVIDPASRDVRVVFSQGAVNGRVVTPAWSPDGSRILFAWAKDQDRLPFRLYSVAAGGGELHQLAGAGDGAHSPAIDSTGNRLVFVGYTEEGYDLFALDLASATWDPVSSNTATTEAPAAARQDAPAQPLESRPYSPVRTLAPTFFTPYIERDGDDTVLGAATAGFDALGRHTYLLSAGWGLEHGHLDVHAEYTYARWRPAIFYGVSGETNSRQDGFIRSRDAGLGLMLPFRQVRWSTDLLGSLSYSRDDLLDADDEFEDRRERYATRAGVRVSNARGFGYSISAEEGAAVSVVTEFARGRDGDETARSVVVEGRGYLGVWPRHGVLAARAAYATSRGSENVRREFSAAGNGPQGNAFSLGFDAVGLLRGFDDGDVFGRSAVSMNLDYRLPLGWVQRGVGTWPFFLRSVHAAVFADTAHAWDETFEWADMRRSAGAELSFDIVLGGAVPMTVATGVAFRHDPTGAREGAAAFVRIGRAF